MHMLTALAAAQRDNGGQTLDGIVMGIGVIMAVGSIFSDGDPLARMGSFVVGGVIAFAGYFMMIHGQ
jgi:hypothetical protein